MTTPIHPADIPEFHFSPATPITQALSTLPPGHTAAVDLPQLEEIHMLIAQMEADGWNVDRIAGEVNLHPVRISQIRATPAYQSYLNQLHTQRPALQDYNLRQNFLRLRAKALSTVEHLMETGSNTIRLKAAQEVLDREAPKVQRTENASVSITLDGKTLTEAYDLMLGERGKSSSDFSTSEEIINFLEQEDGSHAPDTD